MSAASWAGPGPTRAGSIPPITPIFGDLAPGQGFGQRSSGIFGGGQIGYNWQASNYVFGLEGSISGMNNRGTVTNTVFGLARDDVFNWRTNYMATVTARAGYAWANNLIYVKGGYAGVNNRLSVSDTVRALHRFRYRDPVAQWLDGRRRLGIRRDPELDRRPRIRLCGIPDQDLSTRGAAAPLVYTFDAKPRDIQSVVARVSYKFNPPVISRY